MKRILSLLLAAAMLLSLPCILSGAEESRVTIDVPQQTTLFYEDHADKTLADLTAGNSTEEQGGMTPLNNLYDQKIVGTGYPEFPTQFNVKSKALNLMGNHASENTSKNLFGMSNDQSVNAGRGFLTVVPSSVTAGLEQFTVSYLERQYKPSGAFGLALFYQGRTIGGVPYFGGYDNYTFTGFTGKNLGTYAASSVYGGETTTFECAAPETGHKPAKNATLFVSVTCTKGEFTVDGKTWTAKIESYADDILVATSYAQWVDAPIMFYYETTADQRYDVQFTNIRVYGEKSLPMPADEALELLKPIAITGTSVRYSGGAGLRFETELRVPAGTEKAETGVILQEASAYSGTLTLETDGILRSAAPRTAAEEPKVLRETHAFVDSAAPEGKSFFARAYVKLTVGTETVVAYSAPERASCRRTATKVVAGIDETRSTAAMLAACREIAGSVTELNVMSLNVLVSPSVDTAEYGLLTDAERTASAIDMLLTLQPDVVGLQEVSDHILELYRASAELTAIYEITGSPVSGNGDEGLFILWRKDRFTLNGSGLKWLSDTPDVTCSLFPEAVEANASGASFYPRKAVWVDLTDKVSGARFAFCDTHLAYNGKVKELEPVGATLRKKQAEKLAELISGDAMFDHTLPFFVVGDFNDKPNTDPYTALQEIAGDIRYAADTAPATNQGTHHGYEKGKVFLDYIFATLPDFYISEMQVITDLYLDILPSDHYAISGALTLLPD